MIGATASSIYEVQDRRKCTELLHSELFESQPWVPNEFNLFSATQEVTSISRALECGKASLWCVEQTSLSKPLCSVSIKPSCSTTLVLYGGDNLLDY